MSLLNLPYTQSRSSAYSRDILTAEIFLAAHATSTWNERKFRQGHCDPDLSESGRRMAELLSLRPDLKKIKTLYSSDLKRAYQTALPVSRHLQIPILETPLLREGNWADVHRDPAYPSLPFDGGVEDDECLAIRAQYALSIIMKKETSFPLLIITHRGFIRTLFTKLFPVTCKHFKSRQTALNHIRYSNGTWSLKKMNDDSHLIPKNEVGIEN